MKLSTRKDIEAPLETVWTILTDFDHWERAAMRRGIEVRRAAPPGPGAAEPLAWTAALVWRERRRRVELKVAGQEPGQRLVVDGNGDTVAGQMMVDLMDMGPRRTRIVVGVELRPLSLAARLFLQSMKLMRGRLEDRLATRVAAFAADVESRSGHRPPGALRR